MSPIRLLVVEDEPLVAADLAALLQDLGHEVVGTARSGAEALELASQAQFDLATMDIRLGGLPDGIEAAEQLRARHGIGVVYVTAFTDEATLERARCTEPLGYLVKPFQERDVRATMAMATFRAGMERRRTETAGWEAAALESLAAAVIALDLDGRLRFASPSAERLAHPGAVERRLHVSEVLEAPGPEGWGPALAAAAEGQQLAGFTVALGHAQVAPLAFTLAPLRRGRGPVVGHVVTLRAALRSHGLEAVPVLLTCAGCRKVRRTDGTWAALEDYLLDHQGLALSHGLCETCVARLFPQGQA